MAMCAIAKKLVVAGTPGSRACAASEGHCIVPGLSSGTTYEARLKAYNTAGWSKPSPASSFKLSSRVPGAPAAPWLEACGSDSMKVQWSVPPCQPPCTAMQVEVRAAGGQWMAMCGAHEKLVVAGTPGSRACGASEGQCIVPGLKSDTTYEVKLKGYNSAGWGTPSSTRAICLSTLVPGAPAAPWLEAAGSDSMKVQWSAPPCQPPCTAMQVEVKAANDRQWMAMCPVAKKLVVAGTPGSRACAASDGHCIVPVLSSETPYEARLKAYNTAGWSKPSPISSFKLSSRVPGAPAAPWLEAIGSDSMKVQWSVPPCQPPCTAMQVEVRNIAERQWMAMCPVAKKLVVAGTPGSRACAAFEGHCLVPGLSSGTYEARLKAYNTAGWSKASPASSFSLLGLCMPSAPAAPWLEAVGSDSLKVHWSVLSCQPICTAMQVEVRAAGGQWMAMCAIAKKLVVAGTPGSRACAASEGHCIVPGLSSGTTYEARLKAYNTAGWSKPSPTGAMKLEPEDDDALEIVGVETFEDRNAELRKRAISIDLDDDEASTAMPAMPKRQRIEDPVDESLSLILELD